MSPAAARYLATNEEQQKYGEPVLALNEEDLVFPQKTYFAYFAIYHAFALYIISNDLDGLLIVKEALSSFDENGVDSILEEAVASVV
jgi:hypothetical protein